MRSLALWDHAHTHALVVHVCLPVVSVCAMTVWVLLLVCVTLSLCECMCVCVRVSALSQVHFCLGKNESKAGQITRKEEYVAIRTQRAFVSAAQHCSFQVAATLTSRLCTDRMQVHWNACASLLLSMLASTSLRVHFTLACKSRCGHTFKWLANVVVIIAVVADARTPQTIAPLISDGPENTLTKPTTFVQSALRVCGFTCMYLCMYVHI